MPSSPQSINLIQNKKIPLFDKFMDWALTVGRLIVILTEIVALSAFIYRFSLDEKLIDLHDLIKKKQVVVSHLKNDEDKYRNLQDRIALASDFSEKSIKTNKIAKDIIDLMPQEIKTGNVILNGDKINIDIDITSTLQLTDFIAYLKSYPEIKSISIDNIENKSSIGLLVNITVMLE